MVEKLEYLQADVPKLPYKKVHCVIFSAMVEELAFFQEEFSNLSNDSIQIEGFELKVFEYNNMRILLAPTGLGTTFAAITLSLIYHHVRPGYIFLTGTAGGIKSELKLTDVVIVERVFEAEIQGIFKLLKGTPFETCLTHPLVNKEFPSVYQADEELLKIANSVSFLNAKVHKGTVVSSNTFPAPKELFENIKLCAVRFLKASLRGAQRRSNPVALDR